MLRTCKYTHSLPARIVGTIPRTAKFAARLIVYSVWEASTDSYRDADACSWCWEIKSLKQKAKRGANPDDFFTQANSPGENRLRRGGRGSHKVLSQVLWNRGCVFPQSPSRSATDPRADACGRGYPVLLAFPQSALRAEPPCLHPASQTWSLVRVCRGEVGGVEAVRDGRSAPGPGGLRRPRGSGRSPPRWPVVAGQRGRALGLASVCEGREGRLPLRVMAWGLELGEGPGLLHPKASCNSVILSVPHPCFPLPSLAAACSRSTGHTQG